MRSFVVGVAASVAASALVYLALAAVEAVSSALRLGVMAFVLVIGVTVAWLISGGMEEVEGKATSVGRHIRAKANITVKGVDIKRPVGDVRVGDELESDGDVTVEDVQIGPPGDQE